MSGKFGDAIDNFLIIVVAVAIVLLLVVMLGSRQSAFRHKITALLGENPAEKKRQATEFNRQYYITGERSMRKPSRGKNPPQTVIAVLVQKVDERRRTVDPGGTMKLYNEYYELIFKTRKGEILHIVTSKRTYVETPFHQQGQLTFQGDQLIRFQYSGGEVVENPKARRAQPVNVSSGNRK
ncbi:MAG: DUF2500 domain-containing protein [Ruminococcus sp.]|nr:DUF2500 domain-containing protein [Ruminococcus sp.]